MYKPMILRRIPMLSSLIESVETILFIMSGASLLIVVVYFTYHSIAWTLLCVSGLVSLFTFKFASDSTFHITHKAFMKAMNAAKKGMKNGGSIFVVF